MFRRLTLAVLLVVWLVGCGQGPAEPDGKGYLTLDDTTLHLTGTVTWWDCRPVPGVTVELYSTICESLSKCTSTVYGSGLTDADGRFDFKATRHCQRSGGYLQARADSGVVRLSPAQPVSCESATQTVDLVMGALNYTCTPPD